MQNILTIPTDYHMHTTFSPDGDDSMAAMCRQALNLGLTEIAITEHAEWHPKSSGDGFPKVKGYFEAIEACRAEFEPLGLTIHAGVELGNPHQYAAEAADLVARYPFDVVLASLHWLYGENIHLEPCFAGRDPNQVYADYFSELGQMAANFDCDIVAHFDRILWRGTLLGFPFDPRCCESTVRAALATIARQGRTLELNTSMLTHEPNWRKALTTMFRWFLEEGGASVTVSSDAHRVEEIGRHRQLAQQVLVEAGIDLNEQLFRVEPSAELFF